MGTFRKTAIFPPSFASKALASLLFFVASGASACMSPASLDLMDLIWADVIVVANVERYDLDSRSRTAFIRLQTIETIKGFNKPVWEVQWVRWDKSTPAYTPDHPVLVGIRGLIREDGSFSAAVIDKPCTSTALLSIERGAGVGILKDVRRFFRKTP